MRCETCHGTGNLRLFYPVPCRLVWLGYYPCPACGGSGIQSCCEGNCGGPDETTNVPAQPLPPDLPDRVLP